MPAEVDRCVRRILPAIRKQHPDMSPQEQERVAWATCRKMYNQGKLRRDGTELILYEELDGKKNRRGNC